MVAKTAARQKEQVIFVLRFFIAGTRLALDFSLQRVRANN
jgi:hypothetical protein